MLDAQRVSDFAKILETHTGLPRCEDYENYRKVEVPEWVVDHVVATGTFPEDWGDQLKFYSAKSFTVEKSKERAGVVVQFWKDYDWYGY